MALHFTVGRSTAFSEEHAAKEAIVAAAKQAGPLALAVVFSTPQYVQDRLAQSLQAELGGVPWVGGSASVVFSGTELLRRGLVVGLFSGEGIQVGVGMGGPLSQHAAESGRQAAAEALAFMPDSQEGHHRLLLTFLDATVGNPAQAVRGASEVAGAFATWVGGGTGDNLLVIPSVQFAKGRAWRDRVVIVALDSPSRWGTGIEHGWQPYGPPVMVTGSDNNRLRELDYQSAFDVYRHSIALPHDEAFARFSARHPLGIPQIFGWHLIRDPAEAYLDGSIRCVGEVPEGCLVQVMRGETLSLLKAATQAARAAKTDVRTAPLAGALVFECCSRLNDVDGELKTELLAIQKTLGKGLPLAGCLSLGEVGVKGGGPPQFHNKTTVVAAMSV